MKLYVLTFGSYSDRRIAGIFSKKEDAETYKGFDFDANIEEWELDKLKPIPEGYKAYSIQMDKDGSVIDIDECYGYCSPYTFGDTLYIDCFAKDKEHAIKIANEKRAQLIALNEWI